MSKKQQVYRYLIYFVGMIILSIGITLSIRSNLGVSPVTSLPYVFSQMFELPFSLMSFVVYIFYVILQFILKGNKRTWIDLWQLPVSVLFSLLLEVMDKIFVVEVQAIPARLMLLFLSVSCTGIGAAMMVNVKLAPSAADGLAHTLGSVTKKGMGFGKNLLDSICVLSSCIVGFIVFQGFPGIGIGTLCSMVGIGRCVAIFNYFFQEKLQSIATCA